VDMVLRKTGLERWDGTAVPRPAQDRIDEMRGLPRFSEMIRVNARDFQAHFDNGLSIDRSVNDVGHYYMGILALYLDATGGLTHRRLRALCDRIGGAFSSGRATALLWQLRRIGYVTPATDYINGLKRLYVPTSEMRRAFRDHMRLTFRAALLVEPDVAPFLAMIDDPDVFRTYAAVLGEGALEAAANSDVPLKPVTDLWARSNGLLVLYSLVLASDDGGTIPSLAPFPISVAALARRYGCSRSHILRLLREIERAGLMIRDTAGGTTRFTPFGRDLIHRFQAVGAAGMLAMAHRTLVAISAAGSDCRPDLHRDQAAIVEL
jgi:hypothetical protein